MRAESRVAAAPTGSREPACLDPVPIPAVPEEIHAAWLTEALGVRYPGTVVEHCERTWVIHGASTLIHLTLRYNVAGDEHGLPRTMIAKGAMEPHSASMSDLYLREMRFYRDLLPRLKIRAPACYYAARDETGKSFRTIVLMEDLKARGVTFCHPLQRHGYAQVARRLEAMAVYHAQMWNHADLQPGGSLDWVAGSLDSDWMGGYIERYTDSALWPSILARPNNVNLPRRFHDPAAHRGALGQLARLFAASSKTLCHGDTHLGNLYVDADGAPGFFDPFPSHSPWFYEVTYHLICALDVGDRRAWEGALLAHYLEALKRQGVDDAPHFSEAWDLYIRNIAWGMFVFIVNELNFQTAEINGSYMLRFADAALTHDTYGLLGS